MGPEKSRIQRIIHLAGDVGGVAPAPHMKKRGRSPHISGQGIFKSEAASRSIIVCRCAPPPITPGAEGIFKETAKAVTAPVYYDLRKYKLSYYSRPITEKICEEESLLVQLIYKKHNL